MKMEVSALRRRVVIIAFSIILVSAFYFVPKSFTGFVLYSEIEHDVDGEGTVYPNGTDSINASGDFSDTWSNDSSHERIDRLTNIIRWDYFFQTSYNVTPPAEIKILGYMRSTAESTNISLYDYSGDQWNYLGELPAGTTYIDVEILLSYPSYNISNFVNNSGYIQILFEDLQRSAGSLYIDYLAINVTVSPLYDLWFNVTNSTGDAVGNGQNFTRFESEVNVSALWNASGVNSSYAWLNVSGNVNEVQFAHYDSNDNWTNYTLNFSNYTLFPVAGNVSMKLKAYDEFFQQNWTTEMRYLYLWSNASMGGITMNGSVYADNMTIVNGTTHMVSCLVNDSYSGAGIPGYNVSFYINGSFNSSALTNTSGWANFIYTDATPEDANYSLSCNMTDEPGVYYSASALNKTNATVYVITDSDNPMFHENWFEYGGIRLDNRSGYHETGFYRNVTLVANVSDNTSYVTALLAEVTYGTPSTVINHSMAKFGDGLWRFSFDNSDPTRSVNSSLNFSFYFEDARGNHNFADVQGPGGTLSPNSSMTINLTHWESNGTIYNRGENLTFSAYDVNGFIYEGANWSLELLKYNVSANESSSGGVSHFNYTLNASAPPGNWTAWVNTSWSINNGSSTFYFNATDVLTTAFSQPTAGANYKTYEPIVPIVSVSSLEGKPLPWNVTVNLTCYGGQTFTLIRSADSYALSSADSDECKAPGDYSVPFTLTANVTDPKNNTAEIETLDLRTVDQSGGGGTTTSSGGGGGLPLCNCTEWVDVSCGSGDCTTDEMYQERVCTPSGCDTEERCIEKSVCTDIKNFDFSADMDTVSVKQGENATVIFHVDNTGNKEFELSVSLGHGCCKVFPAFTSFALGKKTTVSVPITIHAPLTEETGEYVLSVKFAEKEFDKTKSVKIVVVENDMLSGLDDMEDLIEELRAEIDALSGVGVDVTYLTSLLENAQASLQSARESVTLDDLEVLSAGFSEASAAMENVNGMMLPARMQGFFNRNMANMAFVIIIVFFMIYMLMQVLLPPLTLNRRISKLEKKIKDIDSARKETEKQWMMRKIDDEAFRDLIQKRKDEKNMAVSELKRLKKEAVSPIESKFSPGAILGWVTAKPRKLAGKFKREEKKEENRMEQVQRMLRERQKKMEHDE